MVGLGKKIVGADHSMREFKHDGGNMGGGQYGTKSNN